MFSVTQEHCGMMSSYAQTIVQLYNQLQREGYSEAQLRRIRDAYEFAMRHFSGRFQASGKSFFAHVVGTASILASLGASPAVVAAGLIHNIYANGDFGDGSRGISKAKRDEVRRAVGEEVEQYAARFANLRWNSTSTPAIRDQIGSLNEIERAVISIGLADLLEHHLDLGVLYYGNVDTRIDHAQNRGPVFAEMAEGLGFPRLAAELRRAFEETLAAEIPAYLRPSHPRGHVVAPSSYRIRSWVAFRKSLYDRFRRLRGRARRLAAEAAIRSRLNSTRNRRD